MTENELQNLAAHLRKPSGEDGIKTAKMMFENNSAMIRRAMDVLSIAENDKVLEMGYGNGAHLDYLFEKAKNIRYTGVDISETMQKEANQRNHDKVQAGVADFLLGNGMQVPVEDAWADKFFTVNTLYFWDDHAVVLQEIRRVLQPGGKLCLALASRNFMEKLPFVHYGFQLFHPDEVQRLLQEAGFHDITIIVEKETVPGVTQADFKERELILAVAERPLKVPLSSIS